MTPITTIQNSDQALIAEDAFKAFVDDASFPCVAAKAALNKDQMKLFVAGHIACPKDDQQILDFIYDFVDTYRNADNHFHTACVIFPDAHGVDETLFERFLWMRLQALSDLDAKNYSYDRRVSSDPQSDLFSFSLKEEAFFIIGLNPSSSRLARRFKYPAIVFNPHAQFEELRELKRYDKMKNIVRKKDVALSGSINPMLDDFGAASEVYQYSGMQYNDSWKCPFKPNNK
ncbi:YqcI/YcgG family protein [Chryseobacterium sp. SSA4.19]|uniref:guanitoxin biosynthesis heme-dependent pre-guanitoxin N-hydroxylase GntA n=1 Tax=Chryseobacterium sp. SSA4.19 TaxID=2919915 RepID=UPI001F4EBB63|nr:guanitoxin biosynthesis heme-dependent pre-guanitoxin N-hydroxylase GntA [Chryseobacterium sp. SSA4.19]MCJ8153050.1 YqcI/YcgG family protein [Chryseobacterium sp. SSA4.19]